MRALKRTTRDLQVQKKDRVLYEREDVVINRQSTKRRSASRHLLKISSATTIASLSSVRD